MDQGGEAGWPEVALALIAFARNDLFSFIAALAGAAAFIYVVAIACRIFFLSGARYLERQYERERSRYRNPDLLDDD